MRRVMCPGQAERALARVQAWQKVLFSALAAATLVNIGTVLSVSALRCGGNCCCACNARPDTR
jgi:hypothetical protein